MKNSEKDEGAHLFFSAGIRGYSQPAGQPGEVNKVQQVVNKYTCIHVN